MRQLPNILLKDASKSLTPSKSVTFSENLAKSCETSKLLAELHVGHDCSFHFESKENSLKSLKSLTNTYTSPCHHHENSTFSTTAILPLARCTLFLRISSKKSHTKSAIIVAVYRGPKSIGKLSNSS